MPHFKLTLAYDGTTLVGWQRQASGDSAQGLLEDALAAFDGQPVAVAGAGRTDAGVHALGQVASCSLTRDTDGGTLVRAVNAHLPPAVRVLEAVRVPTDFHARFGSTSKIYRYRIWNTRVLSPFERPYVWHVPFPRLDTVAMNDAARRLEGAHDFSSFQGTGSTPRTAERTIFYARVERGDEGPSSAGRGATPPVAATPLITCEICGDGFLRHMVRCIAGTLVEVGRGRRAPSSMTEVMAARSRASAGATAPASGLFLVSVSYQSPDL